MVAQPDPANHITSLDAALHFARRGWYIGPACFPDQAGACACGWKHEAKDIGKAPLTPHGVDDATTTEDVIRLWFTTWPRANIFVALKPSGLVFIGPDCPEAAEEFARRGLPPTITRYSSNNGYLYSRPDGWPLYRHCRPKWADICTNGYALIWGVHRTGALVYIEPFDGEPAIAPDWAREELTRAQGPVKQPMKTDANDPPVRLSTTGLRLWRGELVVNHAGAQAEAAAGDVDRSNTLFHIGIELNKAGAMPSTIVTALHDRDMALGFNKYSDRRNGHDLSAYQAIAAKVTQDARIPPGAGGDGTRNPNSPVLTRVVPGEGSNVSARDKNVTANVTAERKPSDGNVTRPSFADRVEAWIRTQGGWWDTADLDRDLSIGSKTERDNRRQVVQRLKEKGVVEQHLTIAKRFRYVNTKVIRLDFKGAAKVGTVAVDWPLDIHKYVNLYPGNTAVVAGAPNSGKTALLLNLIRKNMSRFQVYYFCSEMGGDELRSRLERFEGIGIEDWTFHAIDRASDFADVVVPDCVNIIDFLEMTENLYRVNDYLTAISHKLGTGLAVVAIQKKEGARFGRGLEFGLEKPKLYLSMDRGKLEIVKGKAWVNPNVDPNGMKVSFKIVHGWKFEATSEWQAKG